MAALYVSSFETQIISRPFHLFRALGVFKTVSHRACHFREPFYFALLTSLRNSSNNGIAKYMGITYCIP